MKKRTVKEFRSGDGQRRVVVFQMEDGGFSFREEKKAGSSGFWGPLWTQAAVWDSEEEAVNQARNLIQWLRELKS